jgi:hypothetical protein
MYPLKHATMDVKDRIADVLGDHTLQKIIARF